MEGVNQANATDYYLRIAKRVDKQFRAHATTRSFSVYDMDMYNAVISFAKKHNTTLSSVLYNLMSDFLYEKKNLDQQANESLHNFINNGIKYPSLTTEMPLWDKFIWQADIRTLKDLEQKASWIMQKAQEQRIKLERTEMVKARYFQETGEKLQL